MPSKPSWHQHFITVCVGIATTGIIAACGLLFNLTLEVGKIQTISASHASDITDLKLKVEGIRNEISANALEIVRVRTQCETWQARMTRRNQL